MKYPFVSIIIPTYNSEATIVKCLNSMLNLDYKNFEVIVVDDNFKDDTRLILENFKKRSKIKVIYLDNRGISACRNAGIRKARGDIVVFIDSDCFADKDLLKKTVAIFEKHRELDIIAGGKKTWNRKSDLARFVGYQLDYIYDKLTRKSLPVSGFVGLSNYTPTHLCACKKKVFKKIVFDERIKRPCFEDIKFGVEASKIFKVSFFKDLRIWHKNPAMLREFFTHVFFQFYGQLLYQKERNEREDRLVADTKLLLTFLVSLGNLMEFRLIERRKDIKVILKAPLFIALQDLALVASFFSLIKDSLNNDYKVFQSRKIP
jgi:glycosyltransferase involved in cell wall biosynthesis